MRWAVAIAVVVFAGLSPYGVSADEDDGAPPADQVDADTSSNYATVGAVDSTPDTPPDDDDREPQGPVCTSSPARVAGPVRSTGDGFRFSVIDGMYFRIGVESGQVWVRIYQVCVYPNGFRVMRYIWVTEVDPDPRVLVPGTVDEVTERVFAPVPAMSPATQGVVNLGMWLAVRDQGVVSARASASSTTWAETSATLRETVFDFGNGDAITCAGAGDPIPESAINSVEQSPVCGYTFTGTNGGEPFVVTVTSRWSVVSTTSSGLTVAQPDLVLSTSFDYPVVEVQTVGVSG
jgi:hypothetical protein